MIKLEGDDLWADVRRELDCWTANGLKAKFWVRDDDAFQMSESLERLRDLAAKHKIRIGLAVIPGKFRLDLLDFLGLSAQHFHPMCHGWKHVNHNRRNRPAEFGPDRPISNMVMDAQSAFNVFCGRFGTQKAIFVPPFNRVTPALVKMLPNIGFVAISAMPDYLERRILQFGSRLSWTKFIKTPRSSGSPRIDVHIDPINWRTRTAHETTTIVAQLVQQLRSRRMGVLAADKPIGLLTHHLDHDERIWRTCDETLDVLRSHKAAEFIDVAEWIDEHSVSNLAARVS